MNTSKLMIIPPIRTPSWSALAAATLWAVMETMALWRARGERSPPSR